LMMNPVPWLQMTNMISYQGLVRTFPSFDLHFQAISINGISTRRRITEKSHTQCIRNQPFSIVTNRIILGANDTSRTQLR
ncbi:hypothetical protein PO663_24050, partial [Enterobacter roggenkampii]